MAWPAAAAWEWLLGGDVAWPPGTGCWAGARGCGDWRGALLRWGLGSCLLASWDWDGSGGWDERLGGREGSSGREGWKGVREFRVSLAGC